MVYFPEGSFLERVKATVELGYQVYIFDNSPSQRFIFDFAETMSNCFYGTFGENVGLGIGISRICKQAFQDGFEALLFFDQDTLYSKVTLEYVNSFHEYRNIEFNLFAAVQFSNSVSDHGFLFSEFPLREAKLLISSGSLFNLNMLHKMNWHNEAYFVDGVDYEFCLRACINGFLLGKCLNTPEFDHVSGQEDREYLIFASKLYLRAYNAKRLKDILLSYVKLIILSVRHLKIDYLFIFLKSFLQFTFYQILVRILKFVQNNERN